MSAIIKILFLGVISLGIYILTYDQFNPPPPKISAVLFRMEKYLERLTELDKTIGAMLKSDPFSEIMQELRQVIDQLASVSAQTKIYESLERTAGGPKSFIVLSLKTLDKLQIQLYGFESRYRLIVKEMNRNMSSIVDKDIKRLHNDFITIFGDTELFLQDYKIYLTPEEGFTPKITTTLDSIIYWIAQLQRNFAELERTLPGTNVLNFLQGNVKTTTVEQDILAKTIHAITVKHGDSTLTQLGFIWSQTMKGIRQKMDGIADHLHRMKHRYEDLANGVDLDIISTKERIKQLGNIYSKKKEL